MPRKPCAELTLDSPLSTLPGVGPAIEGRLAAHGLSCVEDLLLLTPRRYSDRRENTPWHALSAGEELTIEGVVVRLSRPRGRRGRQLRLALAPEKKGTPRLWCHWYRHPPKLDGEHKGELLRVVGVPRDEAGQLVMSHPEIVAAESPEVVAIYPALEGIAPRSLRRWIGRAMAEDLVLHDPVPRRVLADLHLPGRSASLRRVHQSEPSSQATAAELQELSANVHPARRRLVFEELYLLAFAAALRRRKWRQREARVCALSAAERRRFAETLPFALTGEQRRALGEIWQDMGSVRPMLRLLQGDVGSGKTIVALGACLAAAANGARAALLAPTAALAQQHYATLSPLCDALQISLGLLSGQQARGAALGAQIVVGTHALLGREAELHPLGLVVVDEEHRFGVRQRETLGRHGELVAHRLVMSATPIPRSLALALYGDLDTSRILERPGGRGEVETRRLPQAVVSSGSEAAVRLGERLRAGEQAFVVCPLRSPSAAVEAADVKTAFTRLRAIFPDSSAAFVHGGLDAAEREDTMRAFLAGKIQLLVATTVVEVGIDAPLAQVMVVEHAERFGLAQLHQLRGRVGRHQPGALCLLLSSPAEGAKAAQRLAALEGSSDGFALAEEDLRQRGPGEILGQRQAGMPLLRLADLRRGEHVELMEQAQQQARRALAEDPEQLEGASREALRAIRRRWGEGLCVAEAPIVLASTGGDG